MYLNNSSIVLSYNGKFFNNTDDLFNDLKEISVEKISSIKLRYVNQITPNSKIDDWENWINPKLYNLMFQPEDSRIIRSLNRTEYKIDDFKVIFQYGQFNLNYPSIMIKDDFILDYECLNNYSESINDVKDIVVKMDEIIHNFYSESIGSKLK